MNEEERPLRADVRLGRQGRLVVPAHLRKTLGFAPGMELVAYIRDGQLVVSTREAILDRIQGSLKNPPGRNLIDELIAERREEARMEDEEEREWSERYSTRRRSSP